MGSASCIGRVGGLAVALGVGWAVATTPGLALADGDGSMSSQSPDNSPPPSSPAGSSPDSEASVGSAPPPRAGSKATVPSKKIVLDDPRSGVASSSGGAVSETETGSDDPRSGVASSSGGAVSGESADDTLGSDEVSEGSIPTVEVPDKVVEPTVPDDVSAPAKGARSVPDNPKRSRGASTGKSPAEAKVQSDAVGTAVSRSQPAQADRARVNAPDQRAAQQSVSVSVSNLPASPTTPVAAVTAPVVATAQMTAPPQIPPPSSNPMSTVVIDLLRWAGVGLSPINSPAAPVESPAMLAVLAGWRRLSQQALVGETLIKPADSVQTTEVDGPADASVMQLAAPVSAAAAVAAVDTTPPTVSLTAPPAGTVSGTVTLTANAADDVGVSGVQFLVNGGVFGAEDTSGPYSLTVVTTAADNGTYILAARARDAAGNVTTSAPVTVTVANGVVDVTPPTVSLTAPPTGGTVSGTVTLTANAADNVGVSGVQFLVDGAAQGAEDTTNPYSTSWNTTAAANGTHTVAARARDARGNVTTSAPVTVTVANGVVDVTPPTVSLTAPPTGGTVSGTVTLTANAADNVGVSGVQFLVNGGVFGAEDTSGPYSLTVVTTTADNGTYVLAARARDAAGNVTTSAPVTVTVANGVVDVTPPTVSLTAPPTGATLSGTVTVTVPPATTSGWPVCSSGWTTIRSAQRTPPRLTATYSTPPWLPTALTRSPRWPATPPETSPPRRRSPSPSPTSPPPTRRQSSSKPARGSVRRTGP